MTTDSNAETCKHRHAVEITEVQDAHRRWLCIHCSHTWLEEENQP